MMTGCAEGWLTNLCSGLEVRAEEKKKKREPITDRNARVERKASLLLTIREAKSYFKDKDFSYSLIVFSRFIRNVTVTVFHKLHQKLILFSSGLRLIITEKQHRTIN